LGELGEFVLGDCHFVLLDDREGDPEWAHVHHRLGQPIRCIEMVPPFFYCEVWCSIAIRLYYSTREAICLFLSRNKSATNRLHETLIRSTADIPTHCKLEQDGGQPKTRKKETDER
jgi:hypothetical protein